MTELQILRKSLMSQLKNIDENKADDKQVNNLVNVSNSIIKSYNTELRADELSIANGEKVSNNMGNKVFDKIER